MSYNSESIKIGVRDNSFKSERVKSAPDLFPAAAARRDGHLQDDTKRSVTLRAVIRDCIYIWIVGD
jgi:hypothetical protein